MLKAILALHSHALGIIMNCNVVKHFMVICGASHYISGTGSSLMGIRLTIFYHLLSGSLA